MANVERPGAKGALTTRDGTVLDAEAEQRLAQEAEAGFDPTKLIARPAGRPSLSGRSGHSNPVG